MRKRKRKAASMTRQSGDGSLSALLGEGGELD